MLLNRSMNEIYCYFCGKGYKLSEVYLHVLYFGSITCEYNHLLGNESDKEYEEFINQQSGEFIE